MDGMPSMVERDGYYVATNASVIHDVRIGKDASIWYGCVVRGDVASITIGARTNLQDLTVVHPETDEPMTIGDDVTVGHRAILHMRTLGSGTLVGMGAILLAHSHIGKECIIGAGALIPEGRTIPDRSLVIGMPGKVVRQLTDEEAAHLRQHALNYVGTAKLNLRR
jgi:carbonic anhydrase/acetyltransferase-like protein (isoleucine patch superfamily)